LASKGSPKYPKKNLPLKEAAERAAAPQPVGKHFGKDGLSPVEQGSYYGGNTKKK